MGLQLAYYAEEERLDLTVLEAFDQSLAQGVVEACNYVNNSLNTCIIDCTRVENISETNRVLLLYLMRILENYRVRLIILGSVFQLDSVVHRSQNTERAMLCSSQ